MKHLACVVFSNIARKFTLPNSCPVTKLSNVNFFYRWNCWNDYHETEIVSLDSNQSIQAIEIAFCPWELLNMVICMLQGGLVKHLARIVFSNVVCKFHTV